MTDPQSPSTNTEVQELTDLARRFSDTARYEEAADLLLLALRLEPKNLSVKLGLAEVRKLQQQFKGTSSRSLRDILREGFRRNAIDASHFLGLAHLYAEKGENARAFECIEVAKAKDLANPANHKLHGRLLFRRRDFDGAAEEFGRALRYNPFDRETAESLGRAEYERKQFEVSLGADRARLPAAQRRRRGRGAAAAPAHPDPEADPGLGEPRARRSSSASARTCCTPPSTGWSGTASASSSRAGCRGPTSRCHAAAQAQQRRRPARDGLAPAADQAARPLLGRADLPLTQAVHEEVHDIGSLVFGQRTQRARPLHARAGGDHRPAHHLLRHLRAGGRRARRLPRRGGLHHRPGAHLGRPRRHRQPGVPLRRQAARRHDRELARARRADLLDALAQPGPQAAGDQRPAQVVLLRRVDAGELPAPAQAAGRGAGERAGGALGQDPPLPRAGALAPRADHPRHLLPREALRRRRLALPGGGRGAPRCTSSSKAG